MYCNCGDVGVDVDWCWEDIKAENGDIFNFWVQRQKQKKTKTTENGRKNGESDASDASWCIMTHLSWANVTAVVGILVPMQRVSGITVPVYVYRLGAIVFGSIEEQSICPIDCHRWVLLCWCTGRDVAVLEQLLFLHLQYNVLRSSRRSRTQTCLTVQLSQIRDRLCLLIHLRWSFVAQM